MRLSLFYVSRSVINRKSIFEDLKMVCMYQENCREIINAHTQNPMNLTGKQYLRNFFKWMTYKD